MTKITTKMGTVLFRRKVTHPRYGRGEQYLPRDYLVTIMKYSLREVLPDRPKGMKSPVADVILAEAAMRAGFDVDDVFELMGGRPYGF